MAYRGLLAGHRDVSVYFGAYALGLAAWDVPMYLVRAGSATMKPDAAAVRASLTKPKVDVSFDTWRADMPWLTVYFVLGPWGAAILRKRILEAL